MQAAWLLKNGVPYAQAFGSEGPLSRAEKEALYIQFFIFDGARFDQGQWCFEER